MGSSHSEPVLSLREAADRLGVHPTTLRRWADSGKVRVVLTPGGHRRFPVSEIERLTRPRSGGSTTSVAPRDFAEQAIVHTRDAVARHTDAAWVTEFDEEDREEKRLLGRRLVGLMMQYVSAEDGDGEEVLKEARAIGRLYAKSAALSGLELPEALKATMFFRDNLVESALLLPEAGRSRPEASARLFRRINDFLNTIQLSIAEVYDRAGQREQVR